MLLDLATQGRIRLILDNASLHHSTTNPEPEDQFETLFKQIARRRGVIKRGKFGRYAHDKVLIVSNRTAPGAKGRCTGLDELLGDRLLRELEPRPGLHRTRRSPANTPSVFKQAWDEGRSRGVRVTLAGGTFSFESTSPGTPMEISLLAARAGRSPPTCSTHRRSRSAQEGTARPESATCSSRSWRSTTARVRSTTALRDLHASQRRIFSYGISDNPDGIALYKVGTKDRRARHGQAGEDATAAAVQSGAGRRCRSPDPPQVRRLRRSTATIRSSICGSSNLAHGGEAGQRRQPPRDSRRRRRRRRSPSKRSRSSITSQFLDRVSQSAPPNSAPAAIKTQAAVDAGWFLSTTSGWTNKYFDPNDLYFEDRELFG